jgi:hypothetical protein
VIPITCDFIANASTMRVTKLDACGKPITGTNSFVTECFTSIAMNVVTDDQDDLLYRAANGSLCAVKRGCKTLLGYDIEANIQVYSPELLEVLTGNPVVLDAGGATVGMDDCAISCNAGVALEFWSELIGATCTTTGDQRYLYTLLPYITNGYIGDLEIGSEAINFQFTGSTRVGGQWGTGPFNVTGTTATPTRLLTPLGATCHRRMQIVTLPPPSPACTLVATPALVP